MLVKRNVMALALIAAGVCFTAGVYAAPAARHDGPATTLNAPQDTQDQTQPQAADASASDKDRKKAKKLQAVEVNGFVSSIENSTALKRNANSIVEAVSAEQIGKLPGVSIADTLGRLPGLAVQTVSGRPQVLTIHGLGPDFSTALVNGGQQVSTSNNRDVQFDQYPSSWFNNVVVHLSPQANLIGQGLAGTVDMQTIRPLEKDKPEAAINAHYIWDGMSQLANGPGVSDKGYNVNGVWVNQFADHTVGVTLGVDMESNPSQIQHQTPWGYLADANGDNVVGGAKNYGISDTMKRNGVLATLQWQPNDHYTSTLDLTYDNFKETQQAKGMELPFLWGSAGVAPAPTLVPGNVVDGFVKSGTYENINPIVRNDYNSTSARVYNFNWDNKFRINEDWTADLDATYSRATRRDVNLESYSGTGYYYGPAGPTGTGPHGPGDTIGFSELGNGLLHVDPTLDYTDGQFLTDPEGWGAGNGLVQAGFINAPHTVDYLANLHLDVERSFGSGPFSSVQFGVVRGNRTKTYNIEQNFLTLPGGATTAAINGGGSCDPLSWMGVGAQTCYNPFDMLANGSLEEVPTFMSSLSLPPNWKVREQDVTSYLQFNLDTSLGNVGLRGNVGIQVAHTNQSSEGERVVPGTSLTGGHTALVAVTGGTKFTRYLPSANLIFGLTENDDLRVSAARTMARPRMDQMNASLAVTGNTTHLANNDPNQSFFSATGGNAELLPTMADNYNVSYEHYFSDTSGYQCTATDSKNSDLCRSGGGGYFAVSGYYLKLSDYINPNAAFLYDFSAFVPSYLTPTQQAQLGTTLGTISGPTNDGHGYVKGAQVTLNLPFNLFTPTLNGLGVILTGNRGKSSLVYGDNPSPITVPGLSKWVANGTIYYQHNGFEARVSDDYRSSFLGEVSGISASRIEQTIRGGSTYDAQLSYSFDSGRLAGLTLIAQGSNLSNKTFITYQNNDPRQVLTWERYGRRFDVGVSYKFQ
ncbi:TonB-dependent receptor [Rhodanobacter sp. Col0626]|uniref:TonB-dependent receptor n=1 Tax=Rhodanobacter sp. Col0626 TaxID=3415679 RepID=UPI003CEB0C4A